MRLQYLFLCLYGFFAYSQNSTLVEYQYLQNGGDKIFNYSHFLLYDNNESYYIMPSHKVYKNYEELYSEADYSTHETRKCIYKKSGEKNIFFYGYLAKSKSSFDEKLIKDEINIKYELLEGEEKILGFNCNLAKTKFRGRNYKIWYTKDIPFSAGPWKFFGLPGLILKVEDDFKLFTYQAVRVVQNSDFNEPEKILQSFQNISQKSVSYKEFISLENQLFTELRNKAFSSLPKGVVIKNTKSIRENLIETEFEWEELKKP